MYVIQNASLCSLFNYKERIIFKWSSSLIIGLSDAS